MFYINMLSDISLNNSYGAHYGDQREIEKCNGPLIEEIKVLISEKKAFEIRLIARPIFTFDQPEF